VNTTIVDSETEGNGSSERRSYIASRRLTAKAFGQAARRHWAIENSLHRILDATFNEDHSRRCIGHGASNMALVRHFALNLLRQVKAKRNVDVLGDSFLSIYCIRIMRTDQRRARKEMAGALPRPSPAVQLKLLGVTAGNRGWGIGGAVRLGGIAGATRRRLADRFPEDFSAEFEFLFDISVTDRKESGLMIIITL